MDSNTIERPEANDPVVWTTRYGRVSGHLVRYIDGDTALCELRRGGLLNVSITASDLRVDPNAFRAGNFQ